MTRSLSAGRGSPPAYCWCCHTGRGFCSAQRPAAIRRADAQSGDRELNVRRRPSAAGARGTARRRDREIPYHAHRDDPAEEVHVLIVRQSARRGSWSVYGYQRSTTPYLWRAQERGVLSAARGCRCQPDQPVRADDPDRNDAHGTQRGRPAARDFCSIWSRRPAIPPAGWSIRT